MTDAAPGLRRLVAETAAGPVVVHAEPSAGIGTVLIHGAAGSWTTWLPLLRHAEAAGAPLPGVVAVDLPGWGASPPPRRPLTADDAADVVAAAARAAGIERWIVVGHSLGGFVALQLAAREPARTVAAVLVSPTGPAVVEAVRRPVRGGLRLPWFAGMLVAMRALAALPGEGRPLLARCRRLLPALAAPLFHDRRAVDPALPAALAEEVRPHAFVEAAAAATRADLAAWSGIRCPVRVLRGRHDVFTGPRDDADLARLVPRLHVRVLEDAGHYAHVERPDAVLAAITEATSAQADGSAG